MEYTITLVVSLGPPEVSSRTCVKDWKALMTLMMIWKNKVGDRLGSVMYRCWRQ